MAAKHRSSVWPTDITDYTPKLKRPENIRRRDDRSSFSGGRLLSSLQVVRGFGEGVTACGLTAVVIGVVL